MTGPGTLSFWWKVSCEDDELDDWDYVCVTVDGVEAKRIDGTVDWRQETLTLTAGVHVVRWTYVKDRVVSEGQDSAWLDNVVWTTATRETQTAPVPVPYDWLDGFVLTAGGDYEAAAVSFRVGSAPQPARRSDSTSPCGWWTHPAKSSPRALRSRD